MLYNISGADRVTGEDRIALVEASSTIEAQKKVQKMGILPSEITPHPSAMEPEIDFRDDPAKLSYRPVAVGEEMPDFFWLDFWGGVLLLLGWFCVVVCGICIGLAVFFMIGGIFGSRIVEPSIVGYLLVAGIVGAMSLAPWMILGHAVRPFLMLVKNSFHRP